MQIEVIIKTLTNVLKRHGVIFAYLFGSTAKDEVSPLSDIDIAVYLGETGSNTLFDSKLSLHADICRALKSNNVDLLILNTVTNKILVEEIIRHGIVIYDCDTDEREYFETMSLHQAIDFRTQRLAVMGV